MASEIQKENYIVIQGWMVSDLKLKGNELLIYAIIHGFSQTNSQVYHGSLQYLADWTNSTKQGVSKNLKSLLEKRLIVKKEIYINGVKFCEYHTTKFNRVLNKVEWGIKQSLTNNIDNNIEDNIDNSCCCSIDNNIYNSATTSTTTNLFTFIEKVFGRPLGSSEIEVIQTWEDNELTRYAIKQAELARAFNVRYISKILYTYQKENIKSIAEAEEREKRFQDSKNIEKRFNTTMINKNHVPLIDEERPWL